MHPVAWCKPYKKTEDLYLFLEFIKLLCDQILAILCNTLYLRDLIISEYSRFGIKKTCWKYIFVHSDVRELHMHVFNIKVHFWPISSTKCCIFSLFNSPHSHFSISIWDFYVPPKTALHLHSYIMLYWGFINHKSTKST